MRHHPKCKPGETFLGNHHGATLPPHLASIPGLRLGAVAYYLDGPAIPAAAGYRPLLADPPAAWRDTYPATVEAMRHLSDAAERTAQHMRQFGQAVGNHRGKVTMKELRTALNRQPTTRASSARKRARALKWRTATC